MELLVFRLSPWRESLHVLHASRKTYCLHSCCADLYFYNRSQVLPKMTGGYESESSSQMTLLLDSTDTCILSLLACHANHLYDQFLYGRHGRDLPLSQYRRCRDTDAILAPRW